MDFTALRKISLYGLLVLAVSACGSESPQSKSEIYESCLSISAENPNGRHEDVTLPVKDVEELVESGWEQKTVGRFWKPMRSVMKRSAILFVGGVDGQYIQPADELYDRIASKFATKGVASLFVRYRDSGNTWWQLQSSIADAMGGADFLRKGGINRIAIVGWSFGGAVITQSAVKIPESVTVVGLAPQDLYTEPVSQFTRQSLLLVHSPQDGNLDIETSRNIYAAAPQHIRKTVYEVKHPFEDGQEAHELLGASREVEPIVTKWLETELLQYSERCL